MLDISFIPAFKDNYIWLLRKGRDAVVVDPGDASPVLARLAEDGLQLKAILITHHHADHQGGISALTAAFQVPVYGPENESITGRTVALRGGQTVELLGQVFEVIAVPGHTAGHIAYAMRGALFCGDTLFGAGCGRLFEGTPAQMYVSLSRLAALPAETLVYCAHEYTEANLRFALAVEPENMDVQQRLIACRETRAAGLPTVPTRLAEELATNPFLRSGELAVIRAAQMRNPAAQDPVSVFTAIREWKNVF